MLLALGAPQTRAALFPLSLCVASYGLVDTLLLPGLSLGSRVASVLGHAFLPFLCMLPRGEPPLYTASHVALAFGVLVVALVAYWHWRRWPYVLPVPLSMAVVGTQLLALWSYVRWSR